MPPLSDTTCDLSLLLTEGEAKQPMCTTTATFHSLIAPLRSSPWGPSTVP